MLFYFLQTFSRIKPNNQFVFQNYAVLSCFSSLFFVVVVYLFYHLPYKTDKANFADATKCLSLLPTEMCLNCSVMSVIQKVSFIHRLFAMNKLPTTVNIIYLS